MKRGQRSPGSNACPKLNTLPLPVNWIVLRVVAPMASATAASLFVCAWLAVDSMTAIPAIAIQCIRIVSSLRNWLSSVPWTDALAFDGQTARHGTDQAPARSVEQALNTRWSLLQPRWICQPRGNAAGCGTHRPTFA